MTIFVKAKVRMQAHFKIHSTSNIWQFLLASLIWKNDKYHDYDYSFIYYTKKITNWTRSSQFALHSIFKLHDKLACFQSVTMK